MRTLIRDLHYGVRMLRQSPGFTAVAVLSLALGIGANTAIFSLVDAVLLRLLPVKDPDSLVAISRTTERGSPDVFSYPMFEHLRDEAEGVSGVLASSGASRWTISFDDAGSEGVREQVTGALVSGNYFPVLGINAVHGRTLTTEDNRTPGGHPVAVISHGYWQRRFGLDPSVLGKTFTLNRSSFAIIGVAPPGFFGVSVSEAPDIWAPAMMQTQVNPDAASLSDYNRGWLRLMARLEPGVGQQQARAALDIVFQQHRTAQPQRMRGPRGRRAAVEQRIAVEPGSKGLADLRRQFSRPLLVLMTVVALVLLIACANVANLLLARATARRKEIAVRLALGAGRARLVRQLLTEGFLLAAAGGACGLLLAYWGSNLLIVMVSRGPALIPLDITPDARILGFTAAVSLLAGLLFGLAPALRATSADLRSQLEGGARGMTSAGRRSKAGKVLVVVQVALSLLLLIGAGLFVRSLRNLRTLDTGFNRSNVLMARLNPSESGAVAVRRTGPAGGDRAERNARLANLYRQVLERVSLIPGVHSASMAANGLIMGAAMMRCCVAVDGHTPEPDEDRGVRIDVVTPAFFRTMEMPLLLGREFSDLDRQDAPKVAVVNETFARHYFGSENPVGKRFRWDGAAADAIEIVGVVKDAKYNGLREDTPRLVYFPQLQSMGQLSVLAVRTIGDPPNLGAQVRQALEEVDPNLRVGLITTLAARLDDTLIQERLVAKLTSFFGVLALFLACVGLYGIMSYSVAGRTNEIGTRMALGAQRGDIVWMVLRETLLLAAAGIVLAVPTALATTHLVSSLLFGLAPTDPATITMATLLMLAVAAFSGYLPARRASQVEPMAALRYE